MNRVNGKVAIVTGAARGMGAAFAKRLVEEGAKVMLTDVLREEGEATAAALGANARFMAHDVTSEAQWQQVVAAAEKASGPITVLVNNAGISYGGAIETTSEADYRRVIDVNQVSVFLGMKSVIASMKRAGGGSIINISSIAGITGNAHVLPYTASKFAVRGMTKSAAIELAPLGIRVNSVHPGLIRTPMTTSNDPTTQGALDLLAAGTPVGRAGEPDEVASVVLMLASDESRFSTGAEFVVDGGATAQ